MSRSMTPPASHTELLPNDRKESAVAFTTRAFDWFARHGVPMERVMTDNGSACARRISSGAIQAATHERHLRRRENLKRPQGRNSGTTISQHVRICEGSNIELNVASCYASHICPAGQASEPNPPQTPRPNASWPRTSHPRYLNRSFVASILVLRARGNPVPHTPRAACDAVGQDACGRAPTVRCVASHRRADSSAGMRTAGHHHRAWQPDGRRYTPLACTSQTNQGRSPPKRQDVHRIGIRWVTDCQSSPCALTR